MPENRVNYHSEEIQDIMGRIPGWTIRWGLVVISAIFLGVCVACYFIKYPQIIKCSIQLTSYNPPIELLSRTSNKIAKLFVSSGDRVGVNSKILVLESTAFYNDVISIDNQILNSSDDWEKLVYKDIIYNNYKLGDIQNYFLQYQKRCAAFKNYLETSLLQKKRNLLEYQTTKQIELLEKQNEQLLLLIKDYDLSYKDYTRDSVMLSVDGLSLADYEKSQQGILQKKSSIIGFKSNINSTESKVLELKESLVELEIQMQTELRNYYIELNELKQQLKTQVDKWKNDYLIVSPINGKVFLSRVWSENQNITVSERVATVVPNDSTIILGKIFIPFSGYAKVEIGQSVNIRLDSYPYMEYGSVIGQVRSISPIPEKEGYMVEVIFPKGLQSTYGKHLEYVHQMTGSADVVTKDMRLIEQFIQPMRAIWDKLKL